MPRELDHAERLAILFEGYTKAHGTHGVPRRSPASLKWEIKSTAKTVREPVTVSLWRDHLEGTYPLGIMGVREDGTCRWGSVDYDVYDADLMDLVARAEALPFPLVPCRSKSGGLHLFAFSETWVSADTMQAALRAVAAQLGIAGSEIFPRQTNVLYDRGDLGNWMVMPYFGSTYEDRIKRQVGLKKSGAEMSLTEFLIVADRARLSEDQIANMARARAPKYAKKSAGGADPDASPAGGRDRRHPVLDEDGPFCDGPPCLQHLASAGVGRGHQNNALLMMGIYYKREDPVEWKPKLEAAARDFLDPPGTAEGTAGVIKSLERKEYEYTCKVEPMVSFCNSLVCRSRRFGVGAGLYPVITGISKLDTDPPIWFVDVEDGGRIELNTLELQNYVLFSRKCMEKLTRTFMPMKQSDWTELLTVAMANTEMLESVSEEVGANYRFRELVEEFCTNRQSGEVEQDLLVGRPWLDDERGLYWFRLPDLHKFCVREGMRDITRSYMVIRLREMEGKEHRLNVKGHRFRAWCVSSEKFQVLPELDVPRHDDGGV